MHDFLTETGNVTIINLSPVGVELLEMLENQHEVCGVYVARGTIPESLERTVSQEGLGDILPKSTAPIGLEDCLSLVKEIFEWFEPGQGIVVLCEEMPALQAELTRYAQTQDVHLINIDELE